jgi:hypothetical protein
VRRLGEVLQRVPDSSDKEYVSAACHLLGDAAATLDDAYELVLGRDVDDAGARTYARRPVTDVIQDLVHSEEFREELPVRLARAFPDTPRGFFIHVPKTAGQSIAECLRARLDWVVWGSSMQDPRLVSVPHLLRQTAQAHAQLTAGAQRIWFAGHTYLSRWLARGLVDERSIAFSVTRDPVELYASQASYMVRWIQSHPLNPVSLRWAGWLSDCGLGPDEDVTAAAAAILRSDAFSYEYSNVFCRYLGDGATDAWEALSAVRRARCHVVRLIDVPTFLPRIGAADPPPWLNASPPGYLTATSLTEEDRFYVIDRLAAEDLKLLSALACDALLQSQSVDGPP